MELPNGGGRLRIRLQYADHISKGLFYDGLMYSVDGNLERCLCCWYEGNRYKATIIFAVVLESMVVNDPPGLTREEALDATFVLYREAGFDEAQLQACVGRKLGNEFLRRLS